MQKDDSTGSSEPVNKITKVGTKNAGYTIVASVRLHSNGGSRSFEEDRMICLGVNESTGEMVSWDSYWVGEMMEAGRFGWGGGRYQPYREYEEQQDCDNYAINGFKDRVDDELAACISRAFSRRDRALKQDD